MAEDLISEDLITRLARRLDASEVGADRIAKALRSSPTFRGDLTWLATVFQAADTLPLPAVPADLSASLDSLLGKQRRTVADTSTCSVATASTAMQIFDSRTNAAIGSLGRRASSPETWTLIFSAAVAAVLIDGTTLDDGRTRLAGQVLPRSTDPRPCVVSGEAIAVPIEVDEYGCFDLGAFDSGSHDLTVTAGRFQLHCSVHIKHCPH